MSANGTLANGTLAKRLVGKTTTTHMLTMVFRWGGGGGGRGSREKDWEACLLA